MECPNLSEDKVADAAVVNASDTIGYTITLSNAGPGDADDVVIDDALPATSGTWTIDTEGPDATTAPNCAIVGDALHCDVGTLLAGASVTVH